MLKRLLLVLATLAAAVALALPALPAAAAPSGDHDVIVDLFEWNWPSVAEECTDVLGPAGYGAVQVAPPADSLSRSGHPWWEVYQPADYDLTSRMGNRHQFVAMVDACHDAGVKVYVDAVINHMTGQGSTSYGGKSFGKYNYPGLYSSADFHHYPGDCYQPDGQIHDWNNAHEVTNCELVGLSDLRTQSDYVRDTIAGYLDKLLDIGVDGFRIDAAKHISHTDMRAIENRLDKPAYIYQEVPTGSGGTLAPGAYTGTGDVVDFTYASKLTQQFNGNIANLRTFGESWGLLPENKSVGFVANHDTERNGSTLSYKSGRKYVLASIFSLAWNYGTPKVQAGFSFNSSDDSPPADSNGYVTDTDCDNGWQCLDRTLAGMVGWHNAVGDAGVAHWWSGNNRIAFGRGGKGYIAINNTGSTLTRTFATGLPAGHYCDVVDGHVSDEGECTGTGVTVDDSGNATFSVSAMGAIAIDVDATGTGSGDGDGNGGGEQQVSVTFNEHATTYWGQNVYVVGSIPALGNWDPDAAVKLSSANYPTWSTTVSLPSDTTFQYKFIKKNPDGSITWESDPNRSYTTGSGNATINDSWRGGSITVKVTFNEHATTYWGQNVYVVGSIPQLGKWNPDNAVKLSSANYPTWSTSINLPSKLDFDYKFIKKNPDGSVTWESGSNRSYHTGTSPGTINASWK